LKYGLNTVQPGSKQDTTKEIYNILELNDFRMKDTIQVKKRARTTGLLSCMLLLLLKALLKENINNFR
jgi:hypothetical protein